ncbi:oligosaccharide repeat unit polymerase [bacterium 210820-DFI.6.37]|nr:oligosaccharide repeat unit polymerase [bacterium 210820-DFI.6.37]
MLSITIFIISILFIISFIIFDKDILAPPTVVALVFLFGCFCAFYNEDKWGLEFSYNTTGLIVTAIMSTMIGGFIGVYLSRFPNIRTFSFSYERTELQGIFVSPIKTSVVIIFQIVTLILLFLHIQRLTGYSNWMLAVAEYRLLTGRLADVNDLTIRMSLITRNMVELSFALGMVYAYIVGNNLVSIKKKLSINWIPIILYAITTFMQGDRSNMIRLWLTILIVAYTIHKRSVGWKKSRETRRVVVAMIISIAIIGVLFVSLREIVGRTSDKDPLYYITFYAGSPIAVLDQVWTNPIPKPDIFGKKTFYYLNVSLTALIGWPGKYNFYSDFVKSPNGTSIGNAPTALRDPYGEFGYWGFVVIMIALGVFFTLLYCKTRKKYGTSPIDIRLLLYTYIAYTFFMYFYASFNAFISHTFIKYAIELLIIRWALVEFQFKNRITFKFRKNRKGRIKIKL